jgi:hypothetical protein
MTIDELHGTVVEGFAELRRENRESRAAIDARFGEMDARFGEMDARFGEMDARFGQIDARFREQEETIRRHFDVMVEKVEASVRLVAEGHVHLTTIVGNHEVRLQAIEKRS